MSKEQRERSSAGNAVRRTIHQNASSQVFIPRWLRSLSTVGQGQSEELEVSKGRQSYEDSTSKNRTWYPSHVFFHPFRDTFPNYCAMLLMVQGPWQKLSVMGLVYSKLEGRPCWNLRQFRRRCIGYREDRIFKTNGSCGWLAVLGNAFRWICRSWSPWMG